MQLGTFGAIMSFAMKLEERTGEHYARAELPAELRDDLERSAKKRWKRLEKARREGVVELALESITGLSSHDFALDEGIEKGGFVGAMALEEASADFYRRASEKLPMQEVVRLFLRCAANCEENLLRLREASGGD
jgi:hypothetical protein